MSAEAWSTGPILVIGVLASFFVCPPNALSQTSTSDSAPSAPAAPPGAPAGNTERKFDILEYVVDGNTVLAVPDIEEAVYPFLGEGRDAGDVDKARTALEDAYQKHGFQTVQVDIPQQGIESGIIHLLVTENPVGRLRVVDSKYHLPSQIKQLAPSLAEGTVPNMTEVQKDIVALNQQPDLRVTPHLAAGETPGTVDVDLQVEDHLPLHGSLEVNNQYTENTTSLRVLGTVHYDNLWQLGHSLTVSYLVAPENPSDAQVWSGYYTFPLARTPVSFLLSAVHSDSNVPAVVGTNVIGKGDIFGANVTVTLPGTDTFYQSVTAGLDRKDVSQNVVTGGVPTNVPLVYFPVALSYAATLQEDKTSTQADASLNFAVPGLGSNSAKFDDSRFQATPGYSYLKADLSRTQPLPWDLVGYSKIDGQITADPLIYTEQYSAGGANSVRGYLESERLGDYGIHSVTELRSPSIAALISSHLNDWHFLTFLDGAWLRLHQPLAQQQSSFSLAGAGIGTRLQAFDILYASADLGFPLVDGVVTKAGAPFLHFRVWSEF